MDSETPLRYGRHYTLAEARALLPRVREWLIDIRACRDSLADAEASMNESLQSGHDLGGELVHGWLRRLVRLQELLLEFRDREIQIQDLERGLIDFPAIMEEREVFLCWEEEEPDIKHWHDLDAGYAGRQPLE